MLPFAMLTLTSGGSIGVPTLLPPKAVDLRVKEVRWHPRDLALLYAREESDGIGLGVFCPGNPEGQVVLRLNSGERWSCRWLPGAAANLVTVESGFSPNGGRPRSIALYFVDASKKTAKEVFRRTASGDGTLRLDVDVSPSLVHSVVTLTEGERTTHFVLPLNGGRLLPAPDIDRATAQGLVGPAWSSQGTAMFGPNVPSNDAAVSEDRFLTDLPSLTRDRTTTSSYMLLLSMQREVRHFPELKEGTASLELVPTNGVLRPVRSPGPWIEAGHPPSLLTTENRTMRLDSEGLKTETAGLCILGGIGGPKEASWRVLVAPRSEWGSLSPDLSAVAYTIDGALFVRRIVPR